GQDLALLSDRSRSHFRRKRVGLVFQFFYLLSHLSVIDNITLPSLIAGSDLQESRLRARQLLSEVGLLERALDPVDKLSGGEMQRVALCRALIEKPDIVLADEPTGNLDDDTARSVMLLMLQLTRTQHNALLYVTHSREMAALADEVWELHSGCLDRS
ncbi:MAG TPA: ATP-binding cassette domain-containing protein, partial [Acidobacteriota bacterium]|nr:ATP-binding cassette domain-containing protein [Acidobacteriota bacterium]